MENRKEYYILFSRSGFTEDLLKLAEAKKNIILVNKDQREKYKELWHFGFHPTNYHLKEIFKNGGLGKTQLSGISG